MKATIKSEAGTSATHGFANATGEVTQINANLHLLLNAASHPTRVLKETATIVRYGIASRVAIAALHDPGLPETEVLDSARRIVRFKLRSRNLPRSLIFQLVKYLEFAHYAFRLAKSEEATIINVHNVALLPIGVILKFLQRGKLVYDAHELETEVEGLGGIRKHAAKWLEAFFVRYADLVIVVSPGIEKWYRERYPRANILTILNTPNWMPARRTSLLRDELSIPHDRRIALYQGVLSPGRGISELLSAADSLQQLGYDLVFMGYGPLEDTIRQAATSHTYIHFFPAVPPTVLHRYTSSADIGFIVISDTCLSYHFSLPNKLFEYIMSGIPIICTRLPDIERVVNDYQVGACLDGWDDRAMRKAVQAIEAVPADSLRTRLGNAAGYYRWDRQESLLVAAYQRYILPV